MIDSLAGKGIDFDAMDDNGNTPILWASTKGNKIDNIIRLIVYQFDFISIVLFR